MSAQTQQKTGTPAPAGDQAAATVPALDQVFAETVALFQSLRTVAAKIHAHGDLSSESWTILQGVDRGGAKTVADLANDCAVTSSQMQKLIKTLEKQGVVARVDNPENRRAKFVELTEEGRALIRAMDRREVELLSQLPLTATESDLRAAAEALASVRAAMSDAAWRKLLNDSTG